MTSWGRVKNGLLLAVIVVELTAVAVLAQECHVRWITMLLFSLVLVHGNVFAVWAVLCGERFGWRLLAAVLATGVWTLTLEKAADWITQRYQVDALIGDSVALYVVAQIVAASVPLLIARLAGVTLRQAGVQRLDHQWSPVQFSLRSFLLWIIGFAILLSVLTGLSGEFRAILSPSDILQVLVMLEMNALFATAFVWVVFSSRPLSSRAALGVVLPLVLLICLARAPADQAIIFSISQPLFLIGVLSVFRLIGYRLCWRNRSLL